MPVEPGRGSNVPVMRNCAIVRWLPSSWAPAMVACPGCAARTVTPGAAFEAFRVSLPYVPSARQTVAPGTAALTAAAAALVLETVVVQSAACAPDGSTAEATASEASATT